jgi:hypothetical protein
MAAVQPGALAPGPDVTNKETVSWWVLKFVMPERPTFAPFWLGRLNNTCE